MAFRPLALPLIPFAAFAALVSSTPSTAHAAPLAAGSACVAASDCASGFCVDGVCCDEACAGQCEACDVASGPGTCTPIVGAPHGSVRPPCDALAANDCAKAACDGTVTATCNGFANDASTVCGVDSCTSDGQFQPHGVCDGDGSCVAPAPVVCAPYACISSAPACNTTCASNADCATGNVCVEGSCQPVVVGATCSADGLSSQSATGQSTSCSPYRCDPATGGCFPLCASDADCAGSFVCGTDSLCADPPDVGTPASGGCLFSRRSRAANGIVAVVVAALIGASLRRRRANVH